MRDGPDKGTTILRRAWQKHRGKEHNKAGLLVGKVLHFSLMRGMLSRAVPAAEALTDCLSPSQTMDTQPSAARQLQEWWCLNNRNINACLEEREGRGGEKKSLNGWNFHSALAGAGERGGTSSGGGPGPLLQNLLGVALDRKKMSAGRKPFQVSSEW